MGFLDLFKKKPHTRERYEELRRRNERAEKNYDSALYRLLGSGGESKAIISAFQADYMRANKKLYALREQGHKEALALDKKYNAMVDKLAYDAAELYSFEKEKLGMHRKGEGTKKNVGSLVGVIAVSSFILASILATNITGNVVSLVNGTSSFNSGIIFLLVGGLCGALWLFLKD